MQADELPEHVKWIWAKTNYWGRTYVTHWLPLYQHLLDTAGIAGKLWDEWLATPIKRATTAAMGSERQGRALIQFLAGIHDVGKLPLRLRWGING